jgi:hypothetical protein
MQSPDRPPVRSRARPEVPEPFAAQLRRLWDVNNPLLNALLVAYRDHGWSPPALAAALDRAASTGSKRIERARARPADPELAAAVAEYEIPEPIREYATMDGKRLEPDRITALREMQRKTSRVNGGTATGSDPRQLSQEYAAELNRLVTEEGLTPYYLARVLEVSTRAITSRLERHHFREPCPSVAGSASGLYFNRKVGDPGQGAPRLTPQQRAELRGLWQAYTDGKRGSRPALAAALRVYLDQGFTAANLAQTLSTRGMRVRYGALNAVVGVARRRTEVPV